MSHDPKQPALRFFYGLVPDAAAAAALARTGAALAHEFGGHALGAPDLHMTIAFVGNRPAADRRLLVPPALPLPAELLGRADWPATRLERLASFGRGIVWAGPARTPAWLAELALALRGSLRSAGVGFDEKPMRAHVTLVRGAHRWGRPPPQPAFEAVAVRSWRLALGWSGGAREGPRYDWHLL